MHRSNSITCIEATSKQLYPEDLLQINLRDWADMTTEAAARRPLARITRARVLMRFPVEVLIAPNCFWCSEGFLLWGSGPDGDHQMA